MALVLSVEFNPDPANVLEAGEPGSDIPAPRTRPLDVRFVFRTEGVKGEAETPPVAVLRSHEIRVALLP